MKTFTKMIDYLLNGSSKAPRLKNKNKKNTVTTIFT